MQTNKQTNKNQSRSRERDHLVWIGRIDSQEELALVSLLNAEAAYLAIVVGQEVVQVRAVAAVTRDREARIWTAGLVLPDRTATTVVETG